MLKRYSGLEELMQNETQAKDYFFSLPEYVRVQISQRESNINSYASLQDYAENLLRGDD
ncbi:MAG: hypothetical protein GX800_02385 [Clostridiaceae bacterium]|nr:hypothetical protein [Clostridiaceae bacterium]